ncbi:MAG: iron permease, partial [Synergistaceae bacterium]|nr:iron permease [Synergistaceae bacterium]
LTEADVITGRTVIPAMNGFSIEILSIYDRAETLIPQIMLVIAAVWIMLPHLFRKKNEKSK